MSAFIRADISGLKPYESHSVPGNVRMDANENPFPWPEGMREEVLAYPTAFSRYPDGAALEIRKAIADYNGLQVGEVLVGNGSDELIQLTLNTFAGPGRALVIHPPTFSMYAAAAAVTGTALVTVPLINGTRLDAAGMVQKSAEDPRQKVVMICNPNNPTGSFFTREEILKVLSNTQDVVVVDEAYYEFSGGTMANQIRLYPNLLVMRTFSKAFGLASLRLGYILGNQTLIADLNKVRQPFNVNAFSQQTGIIALQYLTAYQSQIEEIKKETEILYNEMKNISGVTVWPTEANFLLFQTPDSAQWGEKLAERGFSVRYLGDLACFGPSLRMSAGTPEQNLGFLQALREISASIGS